ncbi:MAG: hypothetical protein GY807_09570 [Gammaproteobacteria bacterium]|nr:hypothetical protein [Gammaproteobacteria bacterium]
MTDPQSTSKTPNQSTGKWFWSGFILILLTGVLICIFAAIRGGKQWVEDTLEITDTLPKRWTQVIRVTLSGGQSLYIDHASAPHIQTETQNWLEHRHEQDQNHLLTTLDRKADAVFEKATQNIPAFADWYYSLKGEYTRLFYAAFGDLPSHISQQLQQLVFQPAGTAQAIDALAVNMDARIADQLSHAIIDLQSMLARLVRAHQLLPEEIDVEITGQWALGKPLAARLEASLSLTSQDFARQGIATSTGVTASAVTAKKLGAMTIAKASSKIAGKSSVGILASATSKLGLKSAAKAGGTLAGAGSGAATGAAICTATVAGAPLAPGCALVGGALTGLATWVLVDKAVLEAEEIFTREAFEDELYQALADQRKDLITTLKSQYDNALQIGFKQIGQDFNRQIQPNKTTPTKDFVPAQTTARE